MTYAAYKCDLRRMQPSVEKRPVYVCFNLTQRCADRSISDLRQCMLVRNFVRIEMTSRHCHVWHQSSARAFREQPADSAAAVSPERLQER